MSTRITFKAIADDIHKRLRLETTSAHQFKFYDIDLASNLVVSCSISVFLGSSNRTYDEDMIISCKTN